MLNMKLLLITIITLCVYRSEASECGIQHKFRDSEIIPDVLEEVPELKTLKITYPSGVSVNSGNVLTPTQVKDQPTVEYKAEAGDFYTLLMTGEEKMIEKTRLDSTFISPLQIPTHLLGLNLIRENSDIGCW